jgi:hypothetical protein
MPHTKPNIFNHPIGRLYRLIGFNACYQRHLVGLIGHHDVSAIVIDDAIYVPWHDIEPHSSPADDEDEIADSFMQKSLPIYDPVDLFEDIHASRDHFIAQKKERLSVILSDWPRSAPHTNPFAHAAKAEPVWRDIALVACHVSPQRGNLMGAYESFLFSCSRGRADGAGLPHFFRSLLDAAEIDCSIGSDPFIDLWDMHGFAMPTTTAHTFSVATALLQLVRATQGWRGDPHGSACPGTLMDNCVRLLRPMNKEVL